MLLYNISQSICSKIAENPEMGVVAEFGNLFHFTVGNLVSFKPNLNFIALINASNIYYICIKKGISI